MNFSLLFLGDIFGNKGLNDCIRFVENNQEIKSIDIKFANIENVAEGFGVTETQYNKLIKVGFDLLSGGNHIWDKREILHFISKSKIVRPYNLPSGTPGFGCLLIEKKINLQTIKIGLINVLGRVFMTNVAVDCPFRACDKAIESLNSKGVNIIIVDIHAEATSEKNALAHYLDGRVSAIVGTHTHIPTADERILPKGSAFITDIGACIAQESIIGMSIESILPKFLTGLPSKGEVSNQATRINAVKIDFDFHSFKPINIQRISQFNESIFQSRL